MSDDLLKSYAFRRERETAWLALEQMILQVERKGLKSLSAEELARLPNLYRSTVSALSVARNISLDRALQAYLEDLCSRAFLCVYGPQIGFGTFVARFLKRDWPHAVRTASGAIAISALTLLLGAIVSYVLTIGNLDWYYAFMPDVLVQGRDPTSSVEQLRAVLFSNEHESDELTLFASALFANNAKVGVLCFVLGFALGLPTLALLFETGLMLGTFGALYASRGLGVELWGWLVIHGTTELLAVILCGAAGLLLARAIVFPGQHRRLVMLVEQGRVAGRIVIGAVIMFFVAGLLEGIGRQAIDSTPVRYAIGAAMLAFWWGYFRYAGRNAGDG